MRITVGAMAGLVGMFRHCGSLSLSQADSAFVFFYCFLYCSSCSY